jgi:hypothetical protein
MNDQEYRDLCAALAMLGLFQCGDYHPRAIPKMAFDAAEDMMREREERNERLRSTQGN